MDRSFSVNGIDAGLYLHARSIVKDHRRLDNKMEHLHSGVDIHFHIDNSTTTTLVLITLGACVVTFFPPPARILRQLFDSISGRNS